MSGLPKLRIKNNFRYPFEEIRDFEQAQYFLFSNIGENDLVVVEGQVVESYGELVQLATEDDYKGKEFLEVFLLPAVIGGG